MDIWDVIVRKAMIPFCFLILVFRDVLSGDLGTSEGLCDTGDYFTGGIGG